MLFLNGPHFGLIQGEALQSQQDARTGPANSGQTRETIHLERTPLRVVEDRYSSFNAVALDVGRDEIVLADQNKAQILVYGPTGQYSPTGDPERAQADHRRVDYEDRPQLWPLRGPNDGGYL